MPPGVTSFTPKAALERVQCVVDGLGQLLADAGHLGELVHPGFFHLLQTPQVFEQRLPPFRPHPGNLFQGTGGAGLCPPGPVARDGKAMGFASAEEYLAAANAVILNEEALHKTQKDGDDVYYIEETNEFVIVSTDGYIRTYFYPRDGIEYFDFII